MKHICATLLLLCVNPIQESDRVFIDEVKECALKYNSTLQPEDRIPIKLLIAQAIHESDWGKSRFAVQGNNLFGIKAIDDESFIRAKSGKKVKAYLTKCESVEDYIDLLSFGEHYKEFKNVLINQYISDNVDVYILVQYLYNYAEDTEYENKIKKLIKQLEGV